MPLATPRSGEERAEFIARCMGDSVMVEEFPDKDQRMAVCATQWRERDKTGARNMETKRLARPFELKEMDDETGTFSGYGAVFGNEDAYKDICKRGCFRDSLKAHKAAGTMPAMLWQHDPHEPMGAWLEIKEDDTGLLVKGRLAMGTRRGAEARELMTMKAITGLSIGYRAEEFKVDDKAGTRTLTKVALWEVSPVVFPANPDARIGAVKAADAIKTVREFETFLRDAGGFSNAAAKAIASGGFRATHPRDEGDAEPRSEHRDDAGGLRDLVLAAKGRGDAIATLNRR